FPETCRQSWWQRSGESNLISMQRRYRIGTVIRGVVGTGAMIATGTDATERRLAAGTGERLVEVDDTGAQLAFVIGKRGDIVTDHAGGQTKAGGVSQRNGVGTIAITLDLQYRAKNFHIKQIIHRRHIDQR